jgi:hypothetical protein
MWRMTKYENQVCYTFFVVTLCPGSMRQILFVAHMLKLHNKIKKFVIYVSGSKASAKSNIQLFNRSQLKQLSHQNRVYNA